jgi:hypothetical protein
VKEKLTGRGDFEAALQRLVRVTKSEVDKEEAKWQRMQERLAAKRKAKGKKRR